MEKIQTTNGEVIISSSTLIDAEALRKLVVASLDDDKADDVVSIDLHGKSSFADSMVIASGRSQRHVCSLAENLSQVLKENGLPGVSIEGADQGDWVLLDAGDIVVHLFRPEIRELYNLEKLWSVPAVASEMEGAL